MRRFDFVLQLMHMFVVQVGPVYLRFHSNSNLRRTKGMITMMSSFKNYLESQQAETVRGRPGQTGSGPGGRRLLLLRQLFPWSNLFPIYKVTAASRPCGVSRAKMPDGDIRKGAQNSLSPAMAEEAVMQPSTADDVG